MKTIKNILLGLVTIATFATLGNNALAQEKGSAKGGGYALTQKVKTTAAAEALKPGDTMAMVCKKCETVVISRVETQKGHIKLVTPGTKHLCEGCGSTIEVVGHGKGKDEVVKHSCKACGDDSVFCCATKPGAGSTKGMEKK